LADIHTRHGATIFPASGLHQVWRGHGSASTFHREPDEVWLGSGHVWSEKQSTWGGLECQQYQYLVVVPDAVAPSFDPAWIDNEPAHQRRLYARRHPRVSLQRALADAGTYWDSTSIFCIPHSSAERHPAHAGNAPNRAQSCCSDLHHVRSRQEVRGRQGEEGG